jgi:RHS repeat-associated protein
VYTDPQGTPLAEADASGNITATYDYTPYGTPALGPPPSGPGYTGHVNDPETNLVYMQHRYYDPATGHFMSPDAAPPKPGDLSYMNSYAYVGNNPIMRDDPTGDYICNGSASNCKIIRQGIRDIKKARKKLPDGSKGQQFLQKVLAFYGNEGEDNGVTVDFGNDPKIVGETNTMGQTTEITFNVANLRANGQYPDTSFAVETAATTAHEGQHGIDGQFFGRPFNHAEWYVTENNAYTTESYVDEGMNATSPYGLWHKGWQENPTTNELRTRAAAANAENEVYKTNKAPGQ